MIAIVTNIDDDHLDYFGSIDKVRDSFVTFTNKVPFYGCVILGVDDKQVQMIVPEIKRRMLTYGLTKEAQVSAGKIKRRRASFRRMLLDQGPARVAESQ